jgi:hypothetical protein
MAPERDLLQTEQIGSRRGYFVGKQAAARPEVGTVDDLPQLVIRMTQGKQALSTRAVKRSTDRAVDVSAEVDIARHDGDRLGATHGISTDDCSADQRDHADDGQGSCYPESCSPASRTVADVKHTSAALGVWPRSSSAVLVAPRQQHAGNHFTAISGASTRELVGRMGHVSVNAALVSQHRTASRDRAIADSLDAMVAELKAEGLDVSGHVDTATG